MLNCFKTNLQLGRFTMVKYIFEETSRFAHKCYINLTVERMSFTFKNKNKQIMIKPITEPKNNLILKKIKFKIKQKRKKLTPQQN